MTAENPVDEARERAAFEEWAKDKDDVWMSLEWDEELRRYRVQTAARDWMVWLARARWAPGPVHSARAYELGWKTPDEAA